MFVLIFLFLGVLSAYGHENKLTDAELQSSFMPQELNPAFVSEQDSPWKEVMPLSRTRRNSVGDLPEPSTSITHQIKIYSRIVAGIALVISAIIEVVTYIIEAYRGSGP